MLNYREYDLEDMTEDEIYEEEMLVRRYYEETAFCKPKKTVHSNKIKNFKRKYNTRKNGGK